MEGTFRKLQVWQMWFEKDAIHKEAKLAGMTRRELHGIERMMKMTIWTRMMTLEIRTDSFALTSLLIVVLTFVVPVLHGCAGSKHRGAWAIREGMTQFLRMDRVAQPTCASAAG